MATIHDVARASGFSLGTVSNVINHPARVGAATRAKVEATMQALDFAPNINARNLSLGTSRTVGVIVPNNHQPYFAHIVDGITDAALPTGYRVALLPTNYDAQVELQYLRELRQKAYAGLIFTSSQLSVAQIAQYSRYGQIVMCSAVGDAPVAAAYSDRGPTYREAFTWARRRGYRNVAIMAQREPGVSATTNDMLAAYAAVYGHPLPDRRLRLGITTRAAGYDDAEFLATTDPDVDFIFTTGDDIAAGVALSYQDHGHRMPGVMGAEDQLASTLLNFSTINHHLGTVGHVAFSLAIRVNTRHQLIKSNFIPRG